MDLKATLKPILESPNAKAIIERVQTSEHAPAAVEALYELLPRPIRWMISKEKFSSFILPPLEKKVATPSATFEL